MTRSTMHPAIAALAIVILAAGGAAPLRAQPPPPDVVTFAFNDEINLGSNLDRIGDLQWSQTLGVEWDRNFSFGGIVGKKNATIIPEVRVLGAVVVPRVTADTRTGLRASGNVSGRTGLEFFASFNASGLGPGAEFNFRPKILDLPAEVNIGEFFKLPTNPGVVKDDEFTNPDITANSELVELPSFEAGMDFFFDLALRSRIEGALFPFIRYGSTNFNPPPISVNQSLIKFAFDLDPKSNPDSEEVGIPPTFTMFEGTPFMEEVAFLDDSASLANRQISVEIAGKDDPSVTGRLDIGEVQLVNPFGKGQSALGGDHPNLTISTSMSETTVGYSYETPLLRLGLDLDGIAAFLGSAALTGVGNSFTRIEESFLDGNVSLTADLIDIKYGPEIGFRETVEIKPDFEVTLKFENSDQSESRLVAINDEGQVSIENTWTGRWNDLPGIALLGDEDVEVTVGFNELTGQQTKRSVFYLTDYLEFTLLELEELKLLDAVSLSLPPLFQTRTSLLGSLLGEVELEVTNQTETITPFDIGPELVGGSSFTLKPAPSTKVYLAESGAEFSTDANAWRKLGTDTAPASLDEMTVLVIATRDSEDEESPPQLESDLEPTDLVHEVAGTVRISVAGLAIPEGSTFVQRPDGQSRASWNLSRIVNDGLYRLDGLDGGRAEFSSDTLLTISGRGEMRSEAATHMAIGARILLHGPDHTLTFAGDSGIIIAHQFDNAGQIASDTPGSISVVAQERFNNSGSIVITGGGFNNHLVTPELVNDGLVEVSGSSTTLHVHHPNSSVGGQINIQSTAGTGQFIARDGGTLRFPRTIIGDDDATDFNVDGPPSELNELTFRAEEGGLIQFDEAFEQRLDTRSIFVIEPGGELVLNGIEFPTTEDIPRIDEQLALAYAKAASQFIDVVNRGTLTVASGKNLLFLTPLPPLCTGEVCDPPPPPQPVVAPLNLVNTGEVVIHSGASFGFEVEIKDYAEGGALFDQGTWTLLGATPGTFGFSNLTNPDDAPAGTAVLDLRVVQVSNEDSFIGMVFFGQGNDIQEFDTRLVTNASDITLSGQALFPYLNTMEENRGSLTLLNRNHFTTAGDLLNTGAIRVENEAELNVSGDLVVDEGSVVVDATSVLSAGTNFIEVIGGNVTIQRGAGPLTPPFVHQRWIIREKWVGEDEEGDDIVLDGRVRYDEDGEAWLPTIGPNGDILLEGERAVFEPLAGLERIEGKLTLTGGNELRLAQDLTNVGTLTLADGGKLFVVDRSMINSGHLDIGADSYLEVGEGFTATGGSIHLDGVVRAESLTIDSGTLLSGSGRFVGALQNDGMVSPGNSPGSLIVMGDYVQSAEATLAIDVDGSGADSGFDQLLVSGDVSLDGFLDLSLTDGFALSEGQLFTIFVAAGQLVDNGLQLVGSAASHFDMLVNTGVDGSVVLQFLGGDFPLPGDYNGDGMVDAADYVVWRKNVGAPAGTLLNDVDGGVIGPAQYASWRANFGASASSPASLNDTAVPEPTSMLLLTLAAVVGVLSRDIGRRSRPVTRVGRHQITISAYC